MRKWMIGAGIGVAVIGLVAAGAAFAASQGGRAVERQAVDFAAQSFMGGRLGAFRQGRMGSAGFAGGLHDYVFGAAAESLSLTTEELEAKLAGGQDLSEIALEQGVTAEDLPTLLETARSNALAAAVDDGVLTQEQANWMLEHPVALRMLNGMRAGRGDLRFRGPMGWGSFGPR